jgi:peptidoglycan/LPS O-acetylase OafA/YrhL
LAVEEQFYLFWPFVVAAVSRTKLVKICVGCMIMAPLLRLGLYMVGSDGIAAYVLTPTRMDALAAGGLVALLLRSPDAWHRWSRLAPKLATGAGIGLTCLFVFRRGLPAGDIWVELFGYSLLATLFAVFVGRAAVEPVGTRLERSLSHPAMRAIGRYSYGMYVFHPLVMTGLTTVGFSEHLLPSIGGSLILAKSVFAVGASVVTFVIARTSWRHFESKFLTPRAPVNTQPVILGSA